MPYADPEIRRTKAREYCRRYREKLTPEKLQHRSETHRIWRKKNLSLRARDMKEYRKRNPLASQIRSRIANVLKGRIKCATTSELLGLGWNDFREYLQSLFHSGMTWENYGKFWEVDHIRPCASFDLSDPEQQKICFRWDNLQPLFKLENRKKGARCGV